MVIGCDYHIVLNNLINCVNANRNRNDGLVRNRCILLAWHKHQASKRHNSFMYCFIVSVDCLSQWLPALLSLSNPEWILIWSPLPLKVLSQSGLRDQWRSFASRRGRQHSNRICWQYILLCNMSIYLELWIFFLLNKMATCICLAFWVCVSELRRGKFMVSYFGCVSFLQ